MGRLTPQPDEQLYALARLMRPRWMLAIGATIADAATVCRAEPLARVVMLLVGRHDGDAIELARRQLVRAAEHSECHIRPWIARRLPPGLRRERFDLALIGGDVGTDEAYRLAWSLVCPGGWLVSRSDARGRERCIRVCCGASATLTLDGQIGALHVVQKRPRRIHVDVPALRRAVTELGTLPRELSP